MASEHTITHNWQYIWSSENNGIWVTLPTWAWLNYGFHMTMPASSIRHQSPWGSHTDWLDVTHQQQTKWHQSPTSPPISLLTPFLTSCPSTSFPLPNPSFFHGFQGIEGKTDLGFPRSEIWQMLKESHVWPWELIWFISMRHGAAALPQGQQS